MSAESNKILIKRLFNDVLNRNNPDSINQIIIEDYTEQDLMDKQSQGLNGVKERLEMLFIAFPDAVYELQDIIADENKAAARWKMTGTHKGIFLNIRPTLNCVSLKGIDIYEIKNDKIVSHWNEVDMFGLLNQIKNV
ncbi:MAG: ester cyclase [Ignavibacteria bacterium]|nr:ester cyclase [Ignavibacteria bacterium]